MTSLSDLLKQARPPMPSVPAEPVATQRAAKNIHRRWRDVDALDPETDPESLALEMGCRHGRRDWRDYYWADVTRTAIALLDKGLWKDRQLKELFDFMIDQIGPGPSRPANGSYVRAMFSKYVDTFDPESEATRRLAEVLGQHWPEADLRIPPMLREFDSATVEAVREFNGREKWLGDKERAARGLKERALPT